MENQLIIYHHQTIVLGQHVGPTRIYQGRSGTCHTGNYFALVIYTSSRLPLFSTVALRFFH